MESPWKCGSNPLVCLQSKEHHHETRVLRDPHLHRHPSRLRLRSRQGKDELVQGPKMPGQQRHRSPKVLTHPLARSQPRALRSPAYKHRWHWQRGSQGCRGRSTKPHWRLSARKRRCCSEKYPHTPAVLRGCAIVSPRHWPTARDVDQGPQSNDRTRRGFSLPDLQ